MKKVFLFVVALMVTANVNAGIIKGHVVSSEGEAMPFVTISVMAPDSALLTGTITDEQGEYSVEVDASKYIIQASYVGYQTICGGPDFVLSEETEKLAELEVKAKRPLIER